MTGGKPGSLQAQSGSEGVPQYSANICSALLKTTAETEVRPGKNPTPSLKGVPGGRGAGLIFGHSVRTGLHGARGQVGGRRSDQGDMQ